MAGMIVVDTERCTGCRLCEIVCSVRQEGVSRPSLARIRVVSWEEEGVYLPLLCQHCHTPLCATVCPVDAVQRDEQGCVGVEHDLCVGCRSCISVCPLGGIGFDPEKKRVLRCDLCGGDPVCVKYCETGALQYVECEFWQMDRQEKAARRLYEQRYPSGVRMRVPGNGKRMSGAGNTGRSDRDPGEPGGGACA